MSNDLSPSEVIELAELIAGHSSDDEGNPMPFDVALQIIEDTERYELALTGREYLLHLKLFSAYISYGDLVPYSSLREKSIAAVDFFCKDMHSRGFVFTNKRSSTLKTLLLMLYALILGMTIGILIARHFTV